MNTKPTNNNSFPFTITHAASTWLPLLFAAVLGLGFLACLCVAVVNGATTDYRVFIMMACATLIGAVGLWGFLASIRLRITFTDEDHLTIRTLTTSERFHIDDIRAYIGDDVTKKNSRRMLLKKTDGKTICAIDQKDRGWERCRTLFAAADRRRKRVEINTMLMENLWYVPMDGDALVIKRNVEDNTPMLIAADTEKRAATLTPEPHRLDTYSLEELVDIAADESDHWMIFFATESGRYFIDEDSWEKMRVETPL